MTRTASARPDGADQVALIADGVGRFTPRVAVGQLVEPGAVIGTIEMLGVIERVVSGAAVVGRAVAVTGARQHRTAVDHGAPLVVIDPSVDVAAAAASASSVGAAVGGLAFVAPSSGRYYGRSGPGKPAFVAVGDVIRAGQTVCLLEVMKTFHRVTYGGPGLPDAARVLAIAVADDADVGPGDVILRIEAAEAP